MKFWNLTGIFTLVLKEIKPRTGRALPYMNQSAPAKKLQSKYKALPI